MNFCSDPVVKFRSLLLTALMRVPSTASNSRGHYRQFMAGRLVDLAEAVGPGEAAAGVLSKSYPENNLEKRDSIPLETRAKMA
jgi:hypothetical protein